MPSSLRRPAGRRFRPGLEGMEVRALLSAWFSDATKPNLAEVAGNNRWMASVPDGTLLSNMSIPGTHDSATGDVGFFAIPYVRTQTWSIPNQLNAGVRFLDIRLAQLDRPFSPPALEVVHGPISLHETFGTVLNNCVAFLKANPSETIVMSVKQDQGFNTAEFARIFNTYRRDPRWADYFYTYSAIPTLGQVRGKIVLVARAPGIGGIPWTNLAYSPLVVQDFYTITTAEDFTKKVNLIGQNLDASLSHAPGWHINFASGTGASKLSYTPAEIARFINNFVYDAISDVQEGRVGVIPMDYPGEGLVTRIINANFATNLFPRGPVSGHGTTTVEELLRFGFHAQPTTIEVGFSAPLDPASAEDTSNYRLEELTRGGQTVPVPIASATYDPETDSVTIHPSRRLYLFAPYALVVSGTGPGGVRDATGELVDGDDDGTPGGDFVQVLTRDSLAGPNRA